MKSKRSRSGKLAKITNARWAAYGLAGAATAIGATAAEAEIHYSGPINEQVAFGSKTFALSNGADLWFEHSQTTTDYTKARFELQNAAVSNGWQADQPYPNQTVPENLKRNQFVATQGFGTGVGILAVSPSTQGYEFVRMGYAYVGFKFNTGAGTQYGWARLKMRGVNRGPKNAFYVVDYAWGDVGERIRAGQTSSSRENQAALAPAAGSLGHLALGKAGVQLWRSQRLASVTGR